MTKTRVSNELEDKRQEILQSLRHYRSMVANYQACKELYDSLFPSATQMLTDMPKAPTEEYEPARYADRRLDLRARMERSLVEQQEEADRIFSFLNVLQPEESLVLIRRYMIGESMEQVAAKVNYSIRWCWIYHERAITHIAERNQNGRPI